MSRIRPDLQITGWWTSARAPSHGGLSSPGARRREFSTISSSTISPPTPSPPRGQAMPTCASSSCSAERSGLTASVRTAGLAAIAVGVILARLVSTSLAEEKNLAAARNGAQVIKYTSQLSESRRAETLIDGHGAPGGWASGDGSLPQEILIRLPAVARFNTLVFNLASDGPDGGWAKDVSVHTAEPFPTMGGWKPVAELQLARQPADQVFTVAQAEGRFIRLLITSTHSPGATRVSLNEFKLFLR